MLVDINLKLRPAQAERLMSILKKFEVEDAEAGQQAMTTIHEATPTQTATQAPQEAAEEAPEAEDGSSPVVEPEAPSAAPEAAPAPAKGKVAVSEQVLRAKTLTELKQIAAANHVKVTSRTKDGVIQAIIEQCTPAPSPTFVEPAAAVPAADGWDESDTAVESNDGDDWGEDADDEWDEARHTPDDDDDWGAETTAA